MQPDPTRKSLVGNRQIRKFEETPVSEFPPINQEDLMDTNFIVLGVKGEINVGQYGPSYVVEVCRVEDTTVGYSWLVNKSGVLGRQLAKEVEKGARAFPFETTITEMQGGSGRLYISFAAPTSELPWDGEEKERSKVSRSGK